MRTVLVTGGAGFIGRRQVRALLDAGCRVRVLDDLSTGARTAVDPRASLVVGDVRDPRVVREAVAGCDAVVHLAAVARVGASLEVPAHCLAVNVTGTSNVALAAIDADVEAFVFASSSSVYGARPVPQCESDAFDCLNPYAASKAMGEQLLEVLSRCYGLRACALRYFNVYGPGQPGEGAHALVVGAFLRRTQAGLPLQVHGDGLQTRDFVHVDDVVRANQAALDHLWEGRSAWLVANVGSGEATRISDLARRFGGPVEHTPPREADAPATLADRTLAERVLGWTPRVGLDAGLAGLRARVHDMPEESR